MIKRVTKVMAILAIATCAVFAIGAAALNKPVHAIMFSTIGVLLWMAYFRAR